MKLPVDYTSIDMAERRLAREQYVKEQDGKCFYCKESLILPPPKMISKKKIDWSLFPKNFLRHPIHLQHDHCSGMTEGAVHAYCNAVMWQYEGK